MLAEAALGICILSTEGVATETLNSSDIVVPDILAALDLLLRPLRLVATLRQWTETLNAAHARPREQTRLFNQLLHILAEDLLPNRPERAEPCVRKRRPKAYPLMTKPRHQYLTAARS